MHDNCTLPLRDSYAAHMSGFRLLFELIWDGLSAKLHIRALQTLSVKLMRHDTQ